MPENDELRVAELERHHLSAVATVKRHMEGVAGDYALGWQNACDTIIAAAAKVVARPPLTRDRVEKAVGELMDGIRGATGGHEPFDRVWLTDRLCRLLGVDSP